MATLIITEKTSQARDLRSALGDRFGQILPAEGHLLRLAEPHEVEPSWKSWASILLKPAHMTTADEWHETVARNLTSAFATVRAAGRVMTTGGSVVLVSTVAAAVGLANHDAIAAAKGGVSALARSAAATYAGRRLRVNAVAPGLVDTPLAARITGNPMAMELSRAMHPLGRIGTADDVAAAIEWLLDPATSWVTGQLIGVDGGLSTVRV